MPNLKACANEVSLFIPSKVISEDGTRIGYQSIGKGPGMIIVHGALRDSSDYTRLAEALSHSFTVHLMDRRGRGISGPQGPDYAINKECEDVQAIREATGANYLFGHSFGGLVSLEVAMKDSSFTKLALYEPGVLLQPMDDTWMSNYEQAMQRNDFRGAFTHFVRGMGNTPLSGLPFWYSKFILRMMIRGKHWHKTSRLLTQNLNEHREVQSHASSYPNYKKIMSEVLLLSGGKSPKSTKEMIEELNHTLADSSIETFPQLDHFGPENDNEPDKIARALKNFFLDT
ncbi:putative hydrolase [compost metagenome]